ncbi:MAG: T9SS type A sorting domain-containing protein [Bacteroidota bacterium]
MKKLIFTVLVAAIGTTALAESTGEKASKVSIQTNLKESRMNVIYAYETPSMVTITILDARGKVVTRDRIKNTEGFQQPYDLSDLVTGIYTITMSDEEGEFYATSTLVNNDLSAVRPTSTSKYQLTFDSDKAEKIKVGIYNDQRELVFKEFVMSEGGFSRVYDLGKMDSEHYTFEVISSDKVERHLL